MWGAGTEFANADTMRNVLLIVGAVIALLLIVAFYPGGGPKRTAEGGGPAMLAGAPAVSYTVKRIDGVLDGLDRYRGSVVLMNIWATWCPPCDAEMPELEAFSKEIRAKGVVVIGVDQGESQAVAAAYARKHGVTFPILLDQEQAYGRSYSAVGLPTTIIVDRSGHILKGIDGQLTLAQMREAVAPALRAK
jgi:thiol-disulfide isomerase/thioredoxin